MVKSGRSRRVVSGATWLVFALGVGLAGVLAGRGFVAAEVEEFAADPVTHEVTVGSVGHVLRFEARGSWPMAPLVKSAQGGVVTSVDLPADGIVDNGAQMLTVTLRPVIALVGEVPASRDLMQGLRGPDVEQLQAHLVEQGHLAMNPNGVFNAATRQAVVRWQRSVGFVPADGMVRFGDVAFISELPARVVLSEDVGVGVTVSPGQALIEGATGEAVVEIVTFPDQAAMIPQSEELTASVAGYAWEGRFGPSWTDAAGQVRIPVATAEGRPICGSDCVRALPLGRSSVVALQVVVVPYTQGPVVPVSAISTDPSGQPMVTTKSGEVLPITVVAAHGGMAVVDGVAVGTRIQVFGG
ncbi:MAG: peptidoglycan-binding protein [Promicromonosporaceae bacterium]|nr:peptidoglycan-binding protein [Promicromonosporaceae bacterium]